MSENLSLRKATRYDAPALLGLITALAEFESLPPPDPDAQLRLVEHGFSEQPRFEAWLAEWAGVETPIGYALVFETYSTFLARPTLFLEDIFVLPRFRDQGVGGALFRHCLCLAKDRGCGRMELSCLNWNTQAQQVYEKMGAQRMTDWYLYRLTRETIEQLCR